MKKGKFKPFDDVVDSMAAASGKTGIPLQALKELKRAGCDAFKGSRVNLTRLLSSLSLREAPCTSDVLFMVAEEVAQRIADRLPFKDAKIEADCRKLTETIHLGFGAALCVVEPDGVDQFLKKSAAVFKNVFKSARKKRLSRSNN